MSKQISGAHLINPTDNGDTGLVVEVAAGWSAAIRYQRGGGHRFDGARYAPEDVAMNWKRIAGFEDGRAHYPTSTADSLMKVCGVFAWRWCADRCSAAVPRECQGSEAVIVNK